jgi:hypothetical protein
VAAVWTRDRRKWRILSGLTADDVRKQDERNRLQKLVPVDVAGYLSTDTSGKIVDRYAAIWAEQTGDDDARMYVGNADDSESAAVLKLKE